jgi:hypothetical protein
MQCQKRLEQKAKYIILFHSIIFNMDTTHIKVCMQMK